MTSTCEIYAKRMNRNRQKHQSIGVFFIQLPNASKNFKIRITRAQQYLRRATVATIDMDRKLGVLSPFWGGGAGSPSNTVWPGPRPTCMPSFILMHPTVWPQYTNVTDRTGQDRQTGQRSESIRRTVLQTVAQNIMKNYKWNKNFKLCEINPCKCQACSTVGPYFEILPSYFPSTGVTFHCFQTTKSEIPALYFTKIEAYSQK